MSHDSSSETVCNENHTQKYSILSAVIILLYSAWVLSFTLGFNLCNRFQQSLLRCNAFMKVLFTEWIGRKEHSGASTAKNTKASVVNTTDNQLTVGSTTNASNKRGASWQMGSSNNNRGGTRIASIVPTPTVIIREIYLIFRAFYYHNELMGFAMWNAYMWRTQIDQHFGFPANGFLRMEDILIPHATLPHMIDANEANTYVQTSNTTEIGRISLAHLLLFSIAEQSQFHFSNQQLGFHFVTKRGLNQVPLYKWVNADNGNFDQLEDHVLTAEMNQSSTQCQAFLQTVTAATQNPANPGMFMNVPTRYIMIRQRRNIPEGGMELFDRMLNYARGNVSRHVVIPENVVPIEVAAGPV